MIIVYQTGPLKKKGWVSLMKMVYNYTVGIIYVNILYIMKTS